MDIEERKGGRLRMAPEARRKSRIWGWRNPANPRKRTKREQAPSPKPADAIDLSIGSEMDILPVIRHPIPKEKANELHQYNVAMLYSVTVKLWSLSFVVLPPIVSLLYKKMCH